MVLTSTDCVFVASVILHDYISVVRLKVCPLEISESRRVKIHYIFIWDSDWCQACVRCIEAWVSVS